MPGSANALDGSLREKRDPSLRMDRHAIDVECTENNLMTEM